MSSRSEFRVSVTKDNIIFASAHFITFPGHRCETLHGHNYRTRVVIEGGLDPEAHFVFDFVELKRLMKRLTDEIDHKVLLPLQNPHLQISEQDDAVTVDYQGRPRYRFPKIDCALPPPPHTPLQMLPQHRGGRLRHEPAASGAAHLPPTQIE